MQGAAVSQKLAADAHQLALAGLEQVTHGVVVGPLFAWTPLPKVEGVGEQGCGERQSAKLRHSVLHQHSRIHSFHDHSNTPRRTKALPLIKSRAKCTAQER